MPAQIPERLARAIREAEKSFEAEHYPATLTCGRRALEGIFKQLIPEQSLDKANGRRKDLHDLIEEFMATDDSKEPLKNLSHAIRLSGNLGAHFDLEKDPDRETAETVLLLLRYLIEYFFILPERIRQIEDK